MRTLTNGITVPEDDEAGNVWSDAIEYDLEQLDSLFTLIGNLSSADITRPTSSLNPASWNTRPDGRGYDQIVEVPTGITLDKTEVIARIKSGPNIHTRVAATIEPSSLTVFTIIVNDPTLDLEIIYV